MSILEACCFEKLELSHRESQIHYAKVFCGCVKMIGDPLENFFKPIHWADQ